MVIISLHIYTLEAAASKGTCDHQHLLSIAAHAQWECHSQDETPVREVATRLYSVATRELVFFKCHQLYSPHCFCHSRVILSSDCSRSSLGLL